MIKPIVSQQIKSAKAQELVYKVKKGDTVLSISLQYCHNRNVQDIATQNHLTNPNRIKTGDVLTFTCHTT